MKTNSKILFILTFLLILGLMIPGISFATMNIGNKNINKNTTVQNQKPGQTNTDNRQLWQNKWQQIKDLHEQWQEQKQSIIENLASKSQDIREKIASTSAAAKNATICDNLEKWVVKTDQVLTDRETKIDEKQTERLEKLNEKRDNRDQKLEQFRTFWEEQWDKHFTALEEKASTSEQKQALVDFKEAVKDALASRQAAVDSAINQFRTDLDKLIADRKTAIETARNAYLNAYNAAVQTAKDSCTNGSDPAQIKETLKAALKAARDKFNSDRQAIEKMDVKKLVEARQQAFKEAFDYFKKVMEEERAKLQVAFNQ